MAKRQKKKAEGTAKMKKRVFGLILLSIIRSTFASDLEHHTPDTEYHFLYDCTEQIAKACAMYDNGSGNKYIVSCIVKINTLIDPQEGYLLKPKNHIPGDYFFIRKPQRYDEDLYKRLRIKILRLETELDRFRKNTSEKSLIQLIKEQGFEVENVPRNLLAQYHFYLERKKALELSFFERLKQTLSKCSKPPEIEVENEDFESDDDMDMKQLPINVSLAMVHQQQC